MINERARRGAMTASTLLTEAFRAVRDLPLRDRSIVSDWFQSLAEELRR